MFTNFREYRFKYRNFRLLLRFCQRTLINTDTGLEEAFQTGLDECLNLLLHRLLFAMSRIHKAGQT